MRTFNIGYWFMTSEGYDYEEVVIKAKDKKKAVKKLKNMNSLAKKLNIVEL